MPDLTILNLGAGVQSTTMALMADRGLIEPTPDAAIFADTGWEPRGVYDTLRWLKQELTAFPLEVVSQQPSIRRAVIDGIEPSGNVALVIPAFTQMPNGDKGVINRQCTDKWKVRPINRRIREMLGYEKGERAKADKIAERWFGISTDEAIRMRDSREHWAVNRYPLIELGMSRADCYVWFQQHYPGKELARSACVGCPYHRNEEWLRLKQDDPAAFEDAVAVDARLRQTDYPKPQGALGLSYLHDSLKPLDVAIDKFEANKAMNPSFWDMGAECEGLCGV